jgi:hypothetical protein
MNKLTNKTCSTIGCYDILETDDTLFCKDCRRKWRDLCRQKGIHENDFISEKVVNILLKKSQRRLQP